MYNLLRFPHRSILCCTSKLKTNRFKNLILVALLPVLGLVGCGGDIQQRLDLSAIELLEAHGNTGSDGARWLYASDMYNSGRGLELPGAPSGDRIYAFNDSSISGGNSRIATPNGEFSPSIVPNLPPALTPSTLGGEARTLCLRANHAVSELRTNYLVFRPVDSLEQQQTTTVNLAMAVSEGTRLDLNFHDDFDFNQLRFWGTEMGDSILALRINAGAIYALTRFSGNSHATAEWLADFPMNRSRLALDPVLNLGITFNYEENYCSVHLAEAGGGGTLASVRVPAGYCDVDRTHSRLKLAAVAKRTVPLGPGTSTPQACFRSVNIFDFIADET